MTPIEQIAKMAADSNTALQESAALCQKTIFECNKQKILPASYHLAKKIQAVCVSQIEKNTATLNKIIKENNHV